MNLQPLSAPWECIMWHQQHWLAMNMLLSLVRTTRVEQDVGTAPRELPGNRQGSTAALQQGSELPWPLLRARNARSVRASWADIGTRISHFQGSSCNFRALRTPKLEWSLGVSFLHLCPLIVALTQILRNLTVLWKSADGKFICSRMFLNSPRYNKKII